MSILKLTEALRGGEALVSGRNFEETCVIKVACLEDASKFVLCSAKPNSRQTVIDDQITLNFTFAKSNGLKNNSLVDVMEMNKVQKARKVYVEPVSSGDYEVIVSNFEGIQSSLLEQFQLVWKGAVMPIRFQGLRSSIRVLRLDNDNIIYGRLVEMTEVHILDPKYQLGDEENKSFSGFSFEGYGINSSFIKRKFELQDDMAIVSRNTLANFGVVKNLSDISGLLKYEEREVLVKLIVDDSVPVCYIFMSDSLFSCLELKRPSLIVFTRINLCQVKEPKRLLVKHKEGISLTLAEKEVRSLATGTGHVFFNEGMHIQLCDTMASLHLDPENLAYCKVRPITLKSIPIVFEEEKEQLQKPVHVKNNILIRDLHDQQALIDIVLSYLPVDPELHGTPQYLVSGYTFGNILVTGGSGCGKTTFVDQICKKLEEPPFGIKAVYLNCVHWKGKSPVSISGKLEKIWEDLSKIQPSLLVLDNMDVLFCKTENIMVNNPIEASHTDRIVEKLCSIVENMERNPRSLIIGIAQSKTNLHSKLAVNQGRHFFTYFVKLKNPDKMQRLKLLQMVCPSFLPGETDENFDELLKRMEGYSTADIKCVAERAFDFSFQKHSPHDLANLKVEYDDVEKSLNGYVPTSLQGISLMKSSTIKWSDIGGLKNVKKTLVETLEWPAKYPKLFAQILIRLRSGILLYGPSGTGKTMLASAVARECGINFISIKGPELLSKYIGSSEQNVRDTFKQARQASPCILFFDEFDSLAPRRGHDSTGVTDRVVNQLLTELDGVEGPSKGVWVLAASSRPDMIDPALLRPGRIDVSLYCPLPNKEDRLEILHILTRSLELDNLDYLADVASLTDGFSGADLKGLVYDAQLLALESTDDGKIFLQHWTEVLQLSKPSVSQEEVLVFRRMKEVFSERRGLPTKVDQSVTLA